MVEIRLHGPLAAQFGKVWNLDVSTPAEAVRLIEVNAKGFMRKIMELSDKGMVFRLKSDTHDLGEEELTCKMGRMKRLDIIPIVAGSSAGLRFVAGAVMVTVGLMGWAGPASPYLVSMGASMMLGSVVEWLTPVPKPKDMEQTETKQSWTLNGPGNTIEQGYPVPIIYGEVLTGGYTISAGMSVADTVSTGTASVEIGGKKEGAVAGAWRNFELDNTYFYEFNLTARPSNVTPATYLWTRSGFSGAESVTVTQSNGNYRVKVGYKGVAEGAVRLIEGTVHVEVADASDNMAEASADLSLRITHPAKLG